MEERLFRSNECDEVYADATDYCVHCGCGSIWIVLEFELLEG